MLKNTTKLVALFLAVIVISPALALANGSDHNSDKEFDHGWRNEDRQSLGAWATNEFGVKVFDRNNDSEDNDKNDQNHREDKHNNGLHLGQFKNRGFFPNMFYNGTVTATSANGFTIKTKDGTEFDVDADPATIVQIPHKVIALSDVDINDTVHITGDKTSDDGINASVVYVMPANLSPAMAKGTVTAVTDDTMTIQTSDDTTITVNTDSDTEIVNADHETVAQADVEVGTKAKLIGLWDSVLNVFNAIRIKLF